MRFFTAIPLPEEIKDKVRVITANRLPVPYINIGNLHITLNFFGELPERDLDKIKFILPAIVKNNRSFNLEFEKLVKFRNQLHLTLKDNKKLFDLQRALEKEFIKNGFGFQNREYYPHVKLTNLHMDKVIHPERKITRFPQEVLQVLNFKAESVVLYESKLLLHHPRHTVIAESKLS